MKTKSIAILLPILLGLFFVRPVMADTGLACFMGTEGASNFVGSTPTSSKGQSWITPDNPSGTSVSITAIDVNIYRTSGTVNTVFLYVYSDTNADHDADVLLATSSNSFATSTLAVGSTASTCDDVTGDSSASVRTFTFDSLTLTENTQYVLVLWQSGAGSQGAIWVDRQAADGAPLYADGQWSAYNTPPADFGAGGGTNDDRDFMFEVIGDFIVIPTPTPTPAPYEAVDKPAIKFSFALGALAIMLISFAMVGTPPIVLAGLAAIGVVFAALFEAIPKELVLLGFLFAGIGVLLRKQRGGEGT